MGRISTGLTDSLMRWSGAGPETGLQFSWTLLDLGVVRIRFDPAQQAVQVEPTCEHRQFAFRGPGASFLRSVPVEFHPVVIRVTQVERLADPVIAGPVERDSCGDETPEGVGEGPP